MTKLLLVCGPWGSGTTAVAGMLARLGAQSLQPTFHTFDANTGDSHEAMAFRTVIQKFASEERLAVAPNSHDALVAALSKLRDEIAAGQYGPHAPTRPIFLKYPLSALLILPICQVFDTKLIYVVRPFAEIEATRQRRQWPAYLGEQGAAQIYSEMFRLYVTQTIPTLMVRYTELLADPLGHAQQLSLFGGLGSNGEDIAAAAGFVGGRASQRAK